MLCLTSIWNTNKVEKKNINKVERNRHQQQQQQQQIQQKKKAST